MARQWGVSVSYLGSYSDRLWTQIQQNPAVFLGTGPCTIWGVAYPVCSTTQNLNQRRVLTLSGENPASAALIGNMDLHTSIGNQDYRGLEADGAPQSGQRHLVSTGTTQWSRCYGDDTSGGFRSSRRTMPTRSIRRTIAATAGLDRTHLANLSLGYQNARIRQRSAERGSLRTGVFRAASAARSGSWLTVTTGTDRALNGQRFQEQRVNQVSDDVYGAKTLSSYLNRAAFAQPALGTFGDHERASIKGPAFWAINLAVSKLVSFGTAQTSGAAPRGVQSARINSIGATPSTNFNAGTFGLDSDPYPANPRIMQFGLKYAF